MLFKSNGIAALRSPVVDKLVDIDPEGWQTELVMPSAKRTRGLAGAGLVLLLQVSIFAEPISAGSYAGHWEGASGASGDFHLALASEAGKWKADISFGMNGQDVKCKVTALTVDGAKIHAVYTFDLQGIVLESTIDGERAASKLAGKYRTRVVSDNSAVDEGNWDASIT